MSEDKDEKLTVAQMAEILGVNKTTLRYYNKMGITPSKRDENNYRYYSKNQIKNFIIIKNFRTVGLSIEEIKEIKEKVILNNYEEIGKLLEEKSKKYSEELEEIKKKQKALEKCARYINVIAEIMEVEPNYIYFENNNFRQKEEMIFRTKEIENKNYAILYSLEKFTEFLFKCYKYYLPENRGRGI